MSETPNILLVITDQQAFYGHHRPGEFDYVWPRFERLCSEGVRFDRAYAVCPLCTPARASMMTGVYPSRHGLLRNAEEGGQQDFGGKQQLYSHFLARHGYRNAYVGKWHCGQTRLPADYGIEGWSLPGYGKVYMSDAYRAYATQRGLGDARAHIEYSLDHPEWSGQLVTLHHESPWRFMNGSGVLRGPPEAHEEQFVAHLAVETLRKLAAGDRPWSLVASFWGPHPAYYPTEPFASMVAPESIPEYPSFRDDLAGRPRRHRMHLERRSGRKAWPEWSDWQRVLARAYGQGLQTDAAIGDVLDALEAFGAADNTIVIWCADHGDAVASHGGLWDKWSTFTEEIARVPMGVRWPARIPGGRRSEHLVCNMDATATMLDAAAIPVPGDWDSRSLLPLCDPGDAAEGRHQLVCEHNGNADQEIFQRILLRDRFKYVADLFGGDELYDLVDDPYELRNLVDDPAYGELRDDLRSRIVEHVGGTNDARAAALAQRLSKDLAGTRKSTLGPPGSGRR